MDDSIVVEQEGINFLGKKVKGISGSTIKIIAIISMLIDHTAAVLLEPVINKMASETTDYMAVYNSFVYKADYHMRNIGRLGFPIFCFLLVEGFLHTRSKIKYIIRLGIFALVSEVAFDLAFNEKVLEFGYQNVFVTLFLGMIVISIMDIILHKVFWNKEIRIKGKNLHKESLNKVIRIILTVAVVVLGMYLAVLAKSDYDKWGILTIAVMYLFRNHKNAEMYSGCMTLTLAILDEAWSFLAMIPIALYNGKRGLKLKYVFYIFYPAHLLLLAGLARLFHLV